MTSAMPPSDGRLLDGRYRLGPQLGAGGVADVYRAFDERLHRDVAIKLFRGDVADQLHRHEDEMRTLARLDHPGLVTVLDAGEDDTTHQPYLVMTLIEGPTLARELELGPLPLDRVGEIGMALAAALSYVHAQGLVHRDVKPANVLMSPDGRVHLTDFGIARLVSASHVTRTGDVLGTPAYFAPEQVTGEPVGPPADVYALGLMLLECITGRREYDGTPMEAAMARVNRQPNIPPSLPAAWRDLLAGMTAQAPSARLDAAQVADRLTRISGAGAGDATVAMPVVPATAATTVAMAGGVPGGQATQVMPPVPPVGALPPERGNRRAAWLVALGVLLLLAAAVAAVLLLHKSNGNKGASSDCASGVPAVSGQVGHDLGQLTQLVCSRNIPRSASDQLSPYLTPIGSAVQAKDLTELHDAISRMRSAVDGLSSTLGPNRTSKIDDALTALLNDPETKFATPSPTPTETTPSPSPSQTPTPTPTPTPTATVTPPASKTPKPGPTLTLATP